MRYRYPEFDTNAYITGKTAEAGRLNWKGLTKGC